MTLQANAPGRGYPRPRGYGFRRLAALFRSTVSRAVPAARATKLVFEPLEPRLLLNADAHVLTLDLGAQPATAPAHDVVVRLVEDVATTAGNVNNAANPQPQVEIVQRNDPTHVLASGAASQITSVSILGSGGNDHVTIDTASFGNPQLPAISFAGQGGADTLTVGAVSAPGRTNNTWFLDGNGAGHVEGAAPVTFSGVSRLEGGGADTLHGATT